MFFVHFVFKSVESEISSLILPFVPALNLHHWSFDRESFQQT